MEKLKIFLNNNIFLVILLPLVIIVVISSYYRFFIKHDYFVSYEGACDPKINQCFIGCEDDECTEIYYYTLAEKYALDLKRECGDDVSNCELANICLPEDKDCSITYCDPKIHGNICNNLNSL